MVGICILPGTKITCKRTSFIQRYCWMKQIDKDRACHSAYAESKGQVWNSALDRHRPEETDLDRRHERRFYQTVISTLDGFSASGMDWSRLQRQYHRQRHAGGAGTGLGRTTHPVQILLPPESYNDPQLNARNKLFGKKHRGTVLKDYNGQNHHWLTWTSSFFPKKPDTGLAEYFYWHGRRGTLWAKWECGKGR